MVAVNFVSAMNGLGQYLFNFSTLMPDEDVDEIEEGDWNDEEDEDFDDQFETRSDLNEIRAGDDVGEPDPEDDDHLPDDDLQ